MRGVHSRRVSYGKVEYTIPLQCNMSGIASVFAISELPFDSEEVVIVDEVTLEAKSTTSYSLFGLSMMHNGVLSLLVDVLLKLVALVELGEIGLDRGLSAGIKGSVSADEHTEERGVPIIRVLCGRGELVDFRFGATLASNCFCNERRVPLRDSSCTDSGVDLSDFPMILVSNSPNTRGYLQIRKRQKVWGGCNLSPL